MTTKQGNRRLAEQADLQAWLKGWRAHLVSRRRFLQRLAGGSMAAVFAGPSAADAVAEPDVAGRWAILEAVQQHMLPTEPDAPGAMELDSLSYLRFVVSDETADADERAFILQGAGWLEDMALQLTGSTFTQLDASARERVLRRIEQSEAGKNWLSVILLHLIESILVDPVYGGNRDGAGWRWLAHIPGYPRPPLDKRFPELLKR